MCDRSFDTPQQMDLHQARKRHWGCDACDNLFNSRPELEDHKVVEHKEEEEQEEQEDEYVHLEEEEDDEKGAMES